MGEFGASVAALLETYTNCLGLLKAFKRNVTGRTDKRSANLENPKAHSRLRSSIRSDRTRVSRVYSARLSKVGEDFEKGDSRARSKLKRVLQRLTAAIVNLLNMAKKQRPIIDYESLMSLSNSSRIHAIRTIDQLSQRMTSSVSSTRSYRKTSDSSSTADKTHSRASSSLAAGPASRSKPKSDTRLRGPSREARASAKQRSQELARPAGDLDGHHEQKTVLRKGSGSEKRSHRSSEDLAGQPSRRASRASCLPNRESFLSMASDSTKLGEIPDRAGCYRYSYHSSCEEYNTRPMYPLRAYKPAVKEKESLFRRLFYKKGTSR